MATFRNRNGKWQARIQRQGQVPVSKSFNTRQDAERWARQVEAQMDQGRFVSLRLDERTTLGDLVTRYMAEVTPLMKSAETDLIRLTALKRNPLCKLSLVALTPPACGGIQRSTSETRIWWHRHSGTGLHLQHH